MYQKVNGPVYFGHALGVLSDWVLLYIIEKGYNTSMHTSYVLYFLIVK